MPAWARPSALTATPLRRPTLSKRPVAPVVVEEVGYGVVGHEEVHEAVVVVVGGEDSEAVGLGRVLEAVRLGGLDEGPVAPVLEEEVGLSGQAHGADHGLGPAPPGERALGLPDLLPGGVDVARHVEVEVAVAVGVEEGAAGAPARRLHPGLAPPPP